MVKGYLEGVLGGTVAVAAGCLDIVLDDLEARLTFVDLGILTGSNEVRDRYLNVCLEERKMDELMLNALGLLPCLSLLARAVAAALKKGGQIRPNQDLLYECLIVAKVSKFLS